MPIAIEPKRPEFWIMVVMALAAGCQAAQLFPAGSLWSRLLSAIIIAGSVLGFAVTRRARNGGDK
jgi:hypothetical protein